MAVTYPLDIPTDIGIAQITITPVNATSLPTSPFTFKQQTLVFPGERWEASVVLPRQRREFIAPWKGFLTSLRGQVGTFLLGDPDYTSPRGTVSSCSISGSAGDRSVTATMTGSLLSGDYIQLGTGSSTHLHQVVEDLSGSGTLEIWPALRDNYSGSVTFNNPKGLFRLSTSNTSWSIDENSSYSISFDCVEVL